MLDKIPEHGGHFKITKQVDGYIWIRSRKWPTKYYYKQKWDHRNCRAAEGDPDGGRAPSSPTWSRMPTEMSREKLES